jgi:alpha-beta hydrolase superfamily lysophospholipase
MAICLLAFLILQEGSVDEESRLKRNEDLMQLKQAITQSLAAALIGAGASQAAISDDSDNGVLLAQLMQIERADVYKLESVDAPTVIESKNEKKSNDSAALDVTPVMSWVDSHVKVKAVLVCVHGLGLQKASYAAFGERMAKDGYAVYAMDVRGFGEFQQLPGDRHCDFTKCLEDVSQGLKMARQLHPGVPILIMGESMGGAIAMRVTEEHPELVDGLISSVPGADRHKQLQSALQVGLQLITHGVHSNVNVGKSVVAQSTQKEELRKEWSQDKLARFELTPIELIQFQKFMETNKKNADKITKTPVLMVQGKKDRLVKQEDEDEHLSTFSRIKSEDKELIMVMNAEHLIFEEAQFDEDDIKMVSAWIADHAGKISKQ